MEWVKQEAYWGGIRHHAVTEDGLRVAVYDYLQPPLRWAVYSKEGEHTLQDGWANSEEEAKRLVVQWLKENT